MKFIHKIYIFWRCPKTQFFDKFLKDYHHVFPRIHTPQSACTWNFFWDFWSARCHMCCQNRARNFFNLTKQVTFDINDLWRSFALKKKTQNICFWFCECSVTPFVFGIFIFWRSSDVCFKNIKQQMCKFLNKNKNSIWCFCLQHFYAHQHLAHLWIFFLTKYIFTKSFTDNIFNRLASKVGCTSKKGCSRKYFFIKKLPLGIKMQLGCMQNFLKNNDLVSKLFDVNEWFYGKKEKEYARITKSCRPKWSTHQNRAPARNAETPWKEEPFFTILKLKNVWSTNV